MNSQHTVEDGDPVWRHEPVVSQREAWAKVAAAAFGLWALMVPLAASWVRDAVVKATEESAMFRRDFAEYMRLSERRFTIIEERQTVVIKTLSELDARIDRLDHLEAAKQPANGKR